MEIFGGFMVMLSILGFFLTVLWFILPFVIFAMKGKQDRAVELLEQVEQRLAAIEARLESVSPVPRDAAPLTIEPGSPLSAEPPSSAGA